MARLRDQEEFGPTLDAAAERLGISPTAVEKDYWVSQVLKALAEGYGGDFVFKGGTSLFKAYRIVERFSEDVDILVLPGERGRNAVDTLMKRMAESAAAAVGGTLAAVGSRETGRHRAYEVSYPATRQATALIRTGVLLEMGVRGGSQPHETRPIGCLLGDALAVEVPDLSPYDDLAPFEVSVLHPGRTLLEKLVLIHALAQQLVVDPSTPIPPRSGRHFYDVHQLLGEDRVSTLLGDRDQVREVMTSVEEITRRHFGGGDGVRPEDGFAVCPAFDLDSEVSALLRAAYEATMPELHFGDAPLPTWEAICTRVTGMATLL
ncbi:MAG TPA: nucleotidyl transferase AbiEii/AbiGii toxin family protein [Acidimicrobiales bacterium]|nr:nucleotidyl transferase AbiEii/AbiGii toxin family protein [Acidimicrobiales bacterium]